MDKVDLIPPRADKASEDVAKSSNITLASDKTSVTPHFNQQDAESSPIPHGSPNSSAALSHKLFNSSLSTQGTSFVDAVFAGAFKNTASASSLVSSKSSLQHAAYQIPADSISQEISDNREMKSRAEHVILHSGIGNAVVTNNSGSLNLDKNISINSFDENHAHNSQDDASLTELKKESNVPNNNNATVKHPLAAFYGDSVAAQAEAEAAAIDDSYRTEIYASESYGSDLFTKDIYQNDTFGIDAYNTDALHEDPYSNPSILANQPDRTNASYEDNADGGAFVSTHDLNIEHEASSFAGRQHTFDSANHHKSSIDNAQSIPYESKLSASRSFNIKDHNRITLNGDYDTHDRTTLISPHDHAYEMSDSAASIKEAMADGLISAESIIAAKDDLEENSGNHHHFKHNLAPVIREYFALRNAYGSDLKLNNNITGSELVHALNRARSYDKKLSESMRGFAPLFESAFKNSLNLLDDNHVTSQDAPQRVAFDTTHDTTHDTTSGVTHDATQGVAQDTTKDATPDVTLDHAQGSVHGATQSKDNTVATDMAQGMIVDSGNTNSCEHGCEHGSQHCSEHGSERSNDSVRTDERCMVSSAANSDEPRANTHGSQIARRDATVNDSLALGTKLSELKANSTSATTHNLTESDRGVTAEKLPAKKDKNGMHAQVSLDRKVSLPSFGFYRRKTNTIYLDKNACDFLDIDDDYVLRWIPVRKFLHRLGLNLTRIIFANLRKLRDSPYCFKRTVCKLDNCPLNNSTAVRIRRNCPFIETESRDKLNAKIMSRLAPFQTYDDLVDNSSDDNKYDSHHASSGTKTLKIANGEQYLIDGDKAFATVEEHKLKDILDQKVANLSKTTQSNLQSTESQDILKILGSNGNESLQAMKLANTAVVKAVIKAQKQNASALAFTSNMLADAKEAADAVAAAAPDELPMISNHASNEAYSSSNDNTWSEAPVEQESTLHDNAKTVFSASADGATAGAADSAADVAAYGAANDSSKVAREDGLEIDFATALGSHCDLPLGGRTHTLNLDETTHTLSFAKTKVYEDELTFNKGNFSPVNADAAPRNNRVEQVTYTGSSNEFGGYAYNRAASSLTNPTSSTYDNSSSLGLYSSYEKVSERDLKVDKGICIQSGEMANIFEDEPKDSEDSEALAPCAALAALDYAKQIDQCSDLATNTDSCGSVQDNANGEFGDANSFISHDAVSTQHNALSTSKVQDAYAMPMFNRDGDTDRVTFAILLPKGEHKGSKVYIKLNAFFDRKHQISFINITLTRVASAVFELLPHMVADSASYDWSVVDDDCIYGRNYYNILGYRHNDPRIPQDKAAWLNTTVHPDDRKIFENEDDLIKNAMKGDNYEILYRSLCQNGSYIWTKSIGTVLSRDREKQGTRVLGINIDINRVLEGYEILQNKVLTDILTGLKNRTYLITHIDEIIQRAKLPLTIIFTDVTALKLYNDYLGHAVGDKLLCAATVIMQGAINRVNELIRISGDEIVCLIPNCNEHESHLVQTELINALNKYNANAPVRMPVFFSLGAKTIDLSRFAGRKLNESERNEANSMFYQALQEADVIMQKNKKLARLEHYALVKAYIEQSIKAKIELNDERLFK